MGLPREVSFGVSGEGGQETVEKGQTTMSLLTHLECSACGMTCEKDRLVNLCSACGMPLLARYDLTRARSLMTRETVRRRAPNMWRYQEVMPDPGDYQPMGEGFTPLLTAN